jgi:hypothetical protein
MLEQLVQEAAKNGGITVAIPTGVIASIVTLAIIKGSDLILGRMRGKPKNGNGHGLKPGETQVCRDHGEKLAILNEFKDNAGESLIRIEGKVDRLLEKK